MDSREQQAKRRSLRLRILISVMLVVGQSFLVSCTSGSDDSFGKLLGTTGSDPFGQKGNSAISFSPVTLDFGVTRTMTDSTAKQFTITNASSSTLYIQSLGNVSNAHYQVASSTCPTTPNGFGAGQTCLIDIIFSPKATGSIQWTFGVAFGLTPTTNDYLSTSGVKGLGASSVTFAGIDSIDQVRAASVRLNWTDVVGENGFMAFKLNTVTGSLEYVGTAAAAATSLVVTGLTANTTYTFRVQAIDLFGQLDSNTKNVAATTTLAPILTAQTALLDTTLAGAAVVGQTYFFDFNNIAAGSPGNDTTMSYLCYYDLAIDNLVAPTLPCTGLTGLTLDPSFASNGRFSWTPVTAQGGRTFEILVRGNDGSINADRTFAVDVRDPFIRSNLLFELSANFSNSGKPGINSPLTSVWENLYFFGGTALDGALTGTFLTGWAGDGTDKTNPYRLVFDGVSGPNASRVLLSNPVALGGTFGFSTWIKPSNTALGADAYIFSDGGGLSPGWSLRQIASGLVQLDLGDSPGYEATVLSQNPTAFYKFEETSGTSVADASGNAITGTIITPGSLTYSVAGNNGNAFTFAGNAYVQVAPITFAAGTPAYSVSAWVKTPLPTDGNWKTITRGSAADHHIIFNNSTNEFGSYIGGFVGSGVLANSLSAGWHLFTVTATNTGSKFYVDGNPAGTSTSYSQTNIFAIGNYQSGGQPAGGLDGVAIWLRALSAAEVLSQYSGTCKITVRQGYWAQIAAIFNGSTIQVYNNGVQACTAVPHNAIPNTVQNPSIGANSDGSNAWPGEMADFRIYSNLSSTDIGTNFSTTKDHYLSGPASIANLLQWVDASDPNGTGTAPADGSAISSWKDKSGNSNHLSTSGVTPTYVATGLGASYPGIYYAGAGAHLSALTISGDYTIVFISRLQGTQNARGLGDWTGQNILFGYWSNLMHGFYINNAPENLFGSTTPVAVTANTGKNSYYFTRTGTGGAFKFYKTGILHASNGASSSASFKLQIGCGNGTLGECSKIYVSEFMYYNRVLSDPELATLTSYISGKWGF